MRKFAWLAGLGFVLSGCIKITHTTGAPKSSSTHTEKASFLLWGLVGEADVQLGQICPQGVAWFQNRVEPVDWIVGCITCGIYQPMTIEVACTSGQSYLAVPDPEQNVTYVYELDAEGGAL